MRIVSFIFDVLFPPRETELLLRDTTSLPSLRETKSGVITLSQFTHPTVQAAITENKFYNNTHARQLLAALLEQWIKEQPDTLIFIPIPLGAKRARERGYNQVTAVLQKCTGIKILHTVLVRARETKPQSSLTRADRLKNMQQAFVVTDLSKLTKLHNCTVVLVDDVLTTGATMTAAQSVVLQHVPTNCKLICLALAH